ncbi:MAG: NADH-quinone oxidoreductase subunit L [Proteobacteria bacterium]|nr:MAG: NADH-quinone oxidoreductase subunit L [Pseudomonadota bacterium]
MVESGTATDLLRWIPLLPLLGALVHGVGLGLLRREMARPLVIAISCGAPIAAFAVTCVAFARLLGLPGEQRALVDSVYNWIGSGRVSADLAFSFDALTAVMCLVVTGVGSLIHVYSIGYMDDDHRDDGGFQRFFAYLNLFLCAMLLLVLGDNLLVLFLGWEGVGLCSYLLIGFWYGDRWNAYCGMKAFVVNRIGDFGFLVGIFLLLWSLGDAATLNFAELRAVLPRIAEQTVSVPAWLPGGAEWKLTTLIGLCFFLGACGKSAQIPLYTWLPDAMAGPTPVSALIHAATMVTAGVYMVCRLSFLYETAPGAAATIAWTGGATALFAATMAIAQTDIKKVLAYSTVSQLGYMFVAAGCGAYSAAIFHVGTHAFFKALLFLGSGAVILAMHHEQDTDRMGGLRRWLPVTHAVFLVAVLAIAGFPPFSGFFSKDEVLLSAYAAHQIPGHQALWAIGLVTAAITAFYMWRLHFRTFFGECRADAETQRHIHEPGWTVLGPLVVLAVLSAVGGFFGLPAIWGEKIGLPNALGELLHGVLPQPEHHVSHATEYALAGAAIGAATLGTLVAAWMYVWSPGVPAAIRSATGALSRLVENKYYVDEIYDALIVRPLVAISDRVLFRVVDAGVIDGALVNGTALGVRAFAGNLLKYAQSGLTQGYLVTMVVGTLVIVAWMLR